jgi:hypothetical protein
MLKKKLESTYPWILNNEFCLREIVREGDDYVVLREDRGGLQVIKEAPEGRIEIVPKTDRRFWDCLMKTIKKGS